MLVPLSHSTVSVSMLLAGIASLPANLFMEPILPGYEVLHAPSHAFLVEHKTQTHTQRVLFDNGVRKDPENLAPAIFNLLQSLNASIAPSKDSDVPTQLKKAGIALDSIDHIIWSHSHFDHIGDSTRFPNSTGLVVGPGTKAAFFPGFPADPQSSILESDVAGRTVTEINFNTSTLSIGGFRAHDYFDDGSFYLLDIPGHITGHMGALARVTPTTFILLGADTCHHAGQLRPSPNFVHNFPCPASLAAQHPISPKYFGGPGPGANSSDLRTRVNPLLEIQTAQPSFYEFPAEAEKSIDQLAFSLDSSPDVFVILAHDSSLLNMGGKGKALVKLFPETLDNWKAEGLKERSVWAFADKDNAAYRFSPNSTCDSKAEH